ncbi:putative metallopeptidase [Xanthomonas sp. NCPPB 3005]|uniref:putative metallopeptidase n=1 Tax=Xanthomonas sp. NCPPB 3005 TaxID=3240913 RepID=UPI0035179E96
MAAGSRPLPPAELYGLDLDDLAMRFQPAPQVWEWIEAEVLAEDGRIHNPDHAHLQGADVAVLWAGSSFTKQGRTVVGQAELVAFRAGGWQRARMVRQMVDWFGRVPEVVITLAADHSAHCSDVEWCALVEHELYHIAQEADAFGAPRFRKDGTAVLTMRGHDVEEFVGVVRRYGAGAEVQRLVAAANGRPEVAHLDIARSCGTCLLRAA